MYDSSFGSVASGRQRRDPAAIARRDRAQAPDAGLPVFDWRPRLQMPPVALGRVPATGTSKQTCRCRRSGKPWDECAKEELRLEAPRGHLSAQNFINNNTDLPTVRNGPPRLAPSTAQAQDRLAGSGPANETPPWRRRTNRRAPRL